ncbi:MAG TPA: mechanosensitive ion channel family protein [Candidatus Angelobacter sp.]|nr:mechanosensitive ion channel family protein [Candidatus Angelobacter sp.]
MEKWEDLLPEWHRALVQWTRDDAPKLLPILILTFVFIQLLGFFTSKIIRLSQERSKNGASRAQQVSTITGVVHSAGVSLIVAWAMLQALPLIHIDIRPLLASASIAGLAIGFGAQALVKDMINGFFILVENQYEIGDAIRTAGVSGTVEEITLRHTILRDGDGTLHIVPNGAIQIVSNMTRDWSQVMLHIAVDYSENSDRVVQVLKDMAKDFYNDPEFHEDMVSEPNVPGIERLTGQEVDYLMLVKVRPGQQYAIARELRRRIKTCFEQNRIKAGSPVQIYTGQLPAK